MGEFALEEISPASSLGREVRPAAQTPCREGSPPVDTLMEEEGEDDNSPSVSLEMAEVTLLSAESCCDDSSSELLLSMEGGRLTQCVTPRLSFTATRR